jgi:hypothetical protein
MRRFIHASFVGLAAAVVLGACKPEEVILTPVGPTAGIRFINALPDSAGAYGLDFRFVDIVENSSAFRVAFRNNPVTTGGIVGSSATQYRAAKAGSRHFVIFLDDTIQAIAQTKLKDSTVTLEDGKNYTAILWGEARAGGMKLSIFEENVPDPGAGKVGLRVVNAGPTAIDVRTYPTGGTAPATATWAGVAPYSASTFVSADTGSIRYNVRTAGTATNLFADMTALLGAVSFSTAGPAGKLDIEAIPGTRVAGSAVSLVVFPRSTAGARTPQTSAFAVPAGAFMWDRRPPRGF